MVLMNKKQLSTIIFFIAAFFLSSIARSNDETCQVLLSAIEHERTHDAASIVVREAYRRIGCSVEFKWLPAKRALYEANLGHTGGDVARIRGTEGIHTNLVPVPTPVIFFKGVVFTKTVTRKVKEWSDLKGLLVGIVRGVRYSELGATSLDPVRVNDTHQLFRMLKHGMIDVAVAVLRSGEFELENDFLDSGIHVLGEPVFQAPLYHFVNKKFEHLVPRLNSAILEMRKSGAW